MLYLSCLTGQCQICKGTLWQVFYLSEVPSPPMTPYYPPFTLYTCILYSILIHTGRGGGGVGELTRGKVRGEIVHQAGRKNTNMNDCSSSLQTLLNAGKDYS